MINLIFIRHGATDGNLKKKYIGRTDEPLCKVGKEQARALKKHGFRAEYIFVSPMKRALQTAEAVFENREYTTVDAFREMDFGIFEGKSADELSENTEYGAWVNSLCRERVPGGDDVSEFKMRCTDKFSEIVKSLPKNSSAAFVVHGGVIMAIMEAFEESGRDFYAYRIDNGEFLMCKYENGKIMLDRA